MSFVLVTIGIILIITANVLAYRVKILIKQKGYYTTKKYLIHFES